MAKGNFGVKTIGGGAAATNSQEAASSNKKGFSRISATMVNGGFLPDVFERETNTKSTKKQANSVAAIATPDKSLGNNIAAAFRELKKKQNR